jgi:integrase
MGTGQARRGNTRRRIQDAALELFSAHGYEKTSLREIAEQLDVTKAALYYHFKTKEDIVIGLFEDAAQPIDDLLAWCGDRDRSIFEEATIVDYLAGYQRRADPAPATYYRRFGLLRRFVRWLSRRSGTPDPFLDLEAPPKPQQEADWLTEQEFGRLLTAAEHPPRRRVGLAERDRLVLLTLVQTGLRRAELIALDWADLELEGPRPSLLVRCGKGGKPRRQPLAAPLARELALLRVERGAAADAPVFCGLEGKRLQPTILAGIIRRAAERAAIEKRVTAHTLRHTAATWLRQQTGDARLVAAYLGHSDLSTVSRDAHVAADELHDAAAALAARAAMPTAA